jgi:ABC-2 type transport system ATP-binding protein
VKPLTAESITRRYGDELAVDHIDLEVASGEIHAIVGLNGAGKTTLMRMLLGMIRPDSGRALINGVDVSRAAPATWTDVGHVTETPFTYPELTVRENMVAGARLHGMPTDSVAPVVAELIERFELTHWVDKRAGHLSLGNRQRLGLACALVHRPHIIVLDEPSNSLDPAGVVFIRDLLRYKADAEGAAILVSSHHLDELARIAHRISVLHRGRLVGSLDPDGTDLERRFFDLVHAAEMELRAGGIYA